MGCQICGRSLGQKSDPLSLDCGGDCWGCVGKVEAQMGDPEAIAKVKAEIEQGLRPADDLVAPAASPKRSARP